jgi:hypothetical protein
VRTAPISPPYFSRSSLLLTSYANLPVRCFFRPIFVRNRLYRTLNTFLMSWIQYQELVEDSPRGHAFRYTYPFSPVL